MLALENNMWMKILSDEMDVPATASTNMPVNGLGLRIEKSAPSLRGDA
jgi:hypothetical protein